MASHRQEVVNRVEAWWDKYRVPAKDIERERAEAVSRLAAHLTELGYDA